MNQKKVKFNVIDIIVILALVAGAVFLGVRMFGSQGPAVPDPATDNTYYVTFTADCVREEIAATLVQGSKAEDVSRNMNLGRLVDFTIGESVFYATDSKGNIVQTTKPGHVSVTLICEVTGIDQSTGLLVGKDILNVGREIDLCCGLTQICVTVLRIAAK